jgi:hypothetical protein
MRPTQPAGWIVAAVLSAGAAAALRADDTPTAPQTPEPQGLAAEQIDQWIRQLDDASFAKRQAASGELSKAGKQVVPALEKAAAGDSRETTVRSIDLLKQFFETGSDDAKAAAKEALTRLSTCDKPSAAARAQAALAPQPKTPQPLNPRVVPGGGIQLGRNAQIQLRVQAIGGNNAKRVTIKVVNGEKQIEAVEKDRKIKINQDVAGKIKMEVVEKDEKGKEKTSKYEAKDADELKKRHPEAAKIYEEYAKGGAGNIQIQAIQGNFNLPNGRGPLPVPPRIAPFRPALPKANQDAAKRLEEAQKRIAEMKKELEKATEEANQLKDRVKQMEEAKDEPEETEE